MTDDLWDGPAGTSKTGAHQEILKALDRLDRALALLREVEWVEGTGEVGPQVTCPVCSGEKPWVDPEHDVPRGGHAPDCKLAALLEEDK